MMYYFLSIYLKWIILVFDCNYYSSTFCFPSLNEYNNLCFNRKIIRALDIPYYIMYLYNYSVLRSSFCKKRLFKHTRVYYDSRLHTKAHNKCFQFAYVRRSSLRYLPKFDLKKPKISNSIILYLENCTALI